MMERVGLDLETGPYGAMFPIWASQTLEKGTYTLAVSIMTRM